MSTIAIIIAIFGHAFMTRTGEDNEDRMAGMFFGTLFFLGALLFSIISFKLS